MSILDFFKKKEPPKPHITLTKEEVEEQIKQAWWDLFVSNLPKPVVIDTETEKKATPEIFKDGVPSGFSIDPATWVTYFNCKDIPDFSTKEEAKNYCRSIGQHETSHFTICPSSKRMNVRLVDAALKGFSSRLKGKQAAAVGHLVVNVFGDWTGDYLLGVAKYGREDFSELTRNRLRTTIQSVAGKTKTPSPLWKVLVGTYESLFQDDFGLKNYTNLDYTEKQAVEQCTSIMGANFREPSLWPEKVNQLARTLENIILQSSQQQQGKKNRRDENDSGDGSGSGEGISIPDDVKKQLGPRPSESQLKPINSDEKGESAYDQIKKYVEGKNKEGKEEPGTPEKVDDETLDEIFKLNKNNPGKFAGTLGAFAPVEPDEAIRLMYRIRARDHLIKITEKRDKGSYGTPAGYRKWDVGDPVMGRGGLEIVPSMLSTGVIIPGITTVRRERQVVDFPGRLRQIPDFFWVIDSSGSMNWNPMENEEEYRGSFDKAILAAEGATLYALDHGAKVAGINFSGEDERTRERQVKYQDFTTDLNKLEPVLMLHYNGGTIFPCDKYDEIMRKNKNRVVTALISDFQLSNPDEAASVIRRYTNAQNATYLFDIGGNSRLADSLEKHPGIVRFKIVQIGDLETAVIGQMKKTYDRTPVQERKVAKWYVQEPSN